MSFVCSVCHHRLNVEDRGTGRGQCGFETGARDSGRKRVGRAGVRRPRCWPGPDCSPRGWDRRRVPLCRRHSAWTPVRPESQGAAFLPPLFLVEPFLLSSFTLRPGSFVGAMTPQATPIADGTRRPRVSCVSTSSLGIPFHEHLGTLLGAFSLRSHGSVVS